MKSNHENYNLLISLFVDFISCQGTCFNYSDLKIRRISEHRHEFVYFEDVYLMVNFLFCDDIEISFVDERWRMYNFDEFYKNRR